VKVGCWQGDLMSFWKSRPKCSPTHIGPNENEKVFLQTHPPITKALRFLHTLFAQHFQPLNWVLFKCSLQLKIYTYITGTVKTSSPKFCSTSSTFQNTDQSKKSPNSRKFVQSGVDVMITIFFDFWQRFLTIFGEKIGVFLKNQCYDQFKKKNLALFWVKNANILVQGHYVARLNVTRLNFVRLNVTFIISDPMSPDWMSPDWMSPDWMSPDWMSPDWMSHKWNRTYYT
jgi:hypothetical protein